MEEEEHEVYGGDIPDVGEDVDMATADDEAVKELDEMKKRLKEMEEEAAALREMQAKVEKEMGAVQDPANAAATQASKEEVDSRSVFVGNVRFECPSIIVVLLGNPMFLDYHTCLPRFSYVLLYRCLDLHASCMKTSCMVLSNS